MRVERGKGSHWPRGVQVAQSEEEREGEEEGERASHLRTKNWEERHFARVSPLLSALAIFSSEKRKCAVDVCRSLVADVSFWSHSRGSRLVYILPPLHMAHQFAWYESRFRVPTSLSLHMWLVHSANAFMFLHLYLCVQCAVCCVSTVTGRAACSCHLFLWPSWERAWVSDFYFGPFSLSLHMRCGRERNAFIHTLASSYVIYSTVRRLSSSPFRFTLLTVLDFLSPTLMALRVCTARNIGLI